MLMVYLILMVGIAGGYEQGNMNFVTFMIAELLAFTLMMHEYYRLKRQEQKNGTKKK